jgi:hypothetical protein
LLLAARCMHRFPVQVLKTWMLSPEHVDYPYPTDEEKVALAAQAGITLKQLSVWFTNARKRLWIPLRQMLGQPTPSYIDACLQRKVNNVAEIVARILPAAGAEAGGAGSGDAQTVPQLNLRPEHLDDLKSSSLALYARKVRCARARSAQRPPPPPLSHPRQLSRPRPHLSVSRFTPTVPRCTCARSPPPPGCTSTSVVACGPPDCLVRALPLPLLHCCRRRCCGVCLWLAVASGVQAQLLVQLQELESVEAKVLEAIQQRKAMQA